MAAKTAPQIRREDPPKKAGGTRLVWPDVLSRVAAERGAWMHVRECPTARKAGSLAGQVRARHAADRFEVISRGRHIYARLKTEAAK